MKNSQRKRRVKERWRGPLGFIPFSITRGYFSLYYFFLFLSFTAQSAKEKEEKGIEIKGKGTRGKIERKELKPRNLYDIVIFKRESWNPWTYSRNGHRMS